MAYIVVVNPQILSQAGMPIEGVLFATCISAAAATLAMGLAANYPIALAPGMTSCSRVQTTFSFCNRRFGGICSQLLQFCLRSSKRPVVFGVCGS